MNKQALSILKTMHYDCKSEEGRILLSHAIFKIEEVTTKKVSVIEGFPSLRFPTYAKGTIVLKEGAIDTVMNIRTRPASYLHPNGAKVTTVGRNRPPKLSLEQCFEIINLSKIAGYTLQVLAEKYDCSVNTISNVRNGKYPVLVMNGGLK